MIAQLLLTLLLTVVVLYAWTQLRRSPTVGVLSLLAAAAGLYVVWTPKHATVLAEIAGVGRGADLISYLWIAISLLLLLNLHLKLRSQMELITVLARSLAIAQATPERPNRPQ
jgi:small membrane protein